MAPGPPSVIAIATPAMFPRPTVAESAVLSASKCDTSPGSLGSVYFPRVTCTACLKARTLMNPIRSVKKIAPTTSQRTMNGSCCASFQKSRSKKNTAPIQPLTMRIVRSARSINPEGGGSGADGWPAWYATPDPRSSAGGETEDTADRDTAGACGAVSWRGVNVAAALDAASTQSTSAARVVVLTRASICP